MTDAESELTIDRELARGLRETWAPFFSRFGRLTSVQRATMASVLGGNDVLVCAPTASGKTEAACAPLVERRIRRDDPWTILYISPTRALVNDLYGRLERPLRDLRLRIARRTGDHRDTLTEVPHLLITTPESFDSLLCRGRTDDDHLLANVDAVVLDEIHLLHGTARGEQVKWLLERLRRLRRFARQEGWTRREAIQIVALSATVPSPEEVRDTYLSGGQLIRVPGGREIESVSVECARPTVEDALPAYIERLERAEKILVFSNSRKRVDRLALELRPLLEELGYEVRAHHGSLAQPEREAAEQAIKVERRIVVFATSTLEIGIDIGDIDLVVLDGPAPDIPAFLQRIGRGNRRTDRTRVMPCAGSMTEVLVQSAMMQAARESYLGPLEPGTHYAVARQQLASYIFQGPHRARGRTVLTGLVSTCAPEIDASALLDHLIAEGELVADQSGVRLGDDWSDATARGEIHSNIDGQYGQTVIDQSSGDAIAVGVRYGGGSRLGVGGNLLDVKGWHDFKIEVRRARDKRPVTGSWSYVSKGWIQGAGQPQAIRRYLGFAEDEWPVLHGGGVTTVFHFGGARRKALLELLASRTPASAGVRVDNWTVRMPGVVESKPAWLADVGPGTADILIADQLEQLEYAIALPRANKRLPLSIRLAEVRSWLAVEQQLRIAQASCWTIPSDPAVREALYLLLSEM